MNRSFLALTLALSVIPITALAQDTNAAPPLTDQQRQAMRQTFERLAAQEEQLHQQLRYQILSTLSPVHRRAVAATIGQLAIAPNPDPQAAAKQLDSVLSPGEQQRIMAAHSAFETQSRQLHEQIRQQMQSMMPGVADKWQHGPMNGAMPQHRPSDAGTILLMSLSPHPLMDMMGHGWPGGMPPMQGAPPPQ